MILATAGVLERAEPRLVWKHILTSTVDGITGNVFPSKASALVSNELASPLTFVTGARGVELCVYVNQKP